MLFWYCNRMLCPSCGYTAQDWVKKCQRCHWAWFNAATAIILLFCFSFCIPPNQTDLFLAPNSSCAQEPFFENFLTQGKAGIEFYASENSEQKYRLSIHPKFFGCSIIIEQDAEKENSPPYIVSTITNLMLEKADLLYIHWILTIDYGLLQRWKSRCLPRRGNGKEAQEEAVQCYLMHWWEQKHQSADLPEEKLSLYYSFGPKDLKRKGLANAGMEFLTSFMPLGSKLSIFVDNKESKNALIVGKKFEETLIGAWFEKLGFTFFSSEPPQAPDLPPLRYILIKTKIPRVKTHWNDSSKLGKHVLIEAAL